MQQAGIIIICTEERGGKVMTGTKKNVQKSSNFATLYSILIFEGSLESSFSAL